MFVQAVCRPKCLIVHTCDSRTEWNTFGDTINIKLIWNMWTFRVSFSVEVISKWLMFFCFFLYYWHFSCKFIFLLSQKQKNKKSHSWSGFGWSKYVSNTYGISELVSRLFRVTKSMLLNQNFTEQLYCVAMALDCGLTGKTGFVCNSLSLLLLVQLQ